jgi:hypothetical protein
VSKINQRVDTAIPFQVDSAAIAAITTVRSTTRYIFFTPETDAAVPAVAGTHLYGCFVYEFHHTEN